MSDFTSLGLAAPLLRAIEAQGYTNPTAIQTETIPALLEGRDLIGIAETGGGKTAAFVLPLLEKLVAEDKRAMRMMPRALILAPTRELAKQINDAIRDLAKFVKIRTCAIYGGDSYRTQIAFLERGVDILVATPGRLIDHMKRGTVWLDDCHTFILDEADRMLDMGFLDDVRAVAGKMPQEHQAVMFSATMSDEIRALTESLLENPHEVSIERTSLVADAVEHRALFTTKGDKPKLLLHLIEREEASRVIVFVRTKAQADEVSDFLNDNEFPADSLHGDKKQRERERTIRSFKTDRISYLVATDVAARGLDVKDVTHVINMDTPIDPEAYIHRVGRTGRGGASGKAFTMVDRGEFGLLRAIERLIGAALETDSDHPFELVIDKSKGPKKSFKKDGFRKDGPRRDFKPRGDRFGGEKREYKPREDRFGSEKREWKPREDREEGQKREYKPREDRFGGEKREWKPREDRFEGGKREFKPREDRFDGEKKPFKRREDGFEGGKRPFKDREDRFGGEKHEFRARDDRNGGEKREYRKREDRDGGEKREWKPREDRFSGEKRDFKPRGERSFDKRDGEKRGFGKREGGFEKREGGFEKRERGERTERPARVVSDAEFRAKPRGNGAERRAERDAAKAKGAPTRRKAPAKADFSKKGGYAPLKRRAG
ncbi:DEAD/DEAH box helicase [Pseudokordiimonas caeni]|uniref:DEAD/DEAH box helicase n=1 Tax=Pseudokordiimonas caeni TaxID=2997908 RepID=UPI002811E468|nr:DEAD/DEAH box helicase [Pseudokordiimonas caeni]